MVNSIDQIHSLRMFQYYSNDSKLARLAYIEKKIPSFLVSNEWTKERDWLVSSSFEERYRRIINRVLDLNVELSPLKLIKDDHEKVVNFVGLLKEPDSLKECKAVFTHLPENIRTLLYWSVWIYYGAPLENDFGLKKLNEDLSLLCKIHSPLVHLNAGALCDQILSYSETLYALGIRRQTIELLQKLFKELNYRSVDLPKVRSLIEQLPVSLQTELYQQVTAFSFHRKEQEDWGKKETFKNPKALLHLRNPCQKDINLLEFHLKEQTLGLEELERMVKIEEFDRLTILYKMVNQFQWEKIIDKVSPEVRQWISDPVEQARKKECLQSNGRYIYQWRGAHPKLDSTQFQVFAPHARQVKLVLTAYGKEEHCIPMQRNHFGIWEAYTSHAYPGRTYRYFIEDCHGKWNYRTDPFGFSVVESNRILESVVTDSHAFLWNDQEWMKNRRCHSPAKRPLSIYELHVDSWKKCEGKPLPFDELAKAIVEYQKQLCFTHVQLYGVLDNKNDYSWGYQTDHFFAPNRRLGNADGFKFLVDLCHQHEIGVIVDWVPAHYKHEHNGDRTQSLYEYDGTDLFGSESSNWGTVFFNFDKDETRRLLFASALYWLEEAHVDGLRVDAVSAVVRRNGVDRASAIQFLKELNTVVHEQYPGIIMIAEETDGFANVTRPVHEGGLGFDAKLAIHMQARMRHYFCTPYHQRGDEHHHFGKLLCNLNEIEQQPEQWLIAHSHDDASGGSLHHQYSTLYGSIPSQNAWHKFADLRLFHAWNLLSPGVGHMIHMGDEIGQRWPWNERLESSEGAVEWHLLSFHPESSFHRGVQECVGDLNRLYRSKQAFWKQGKMGCKIISHYAPAKVLGFQRLDYEGERLSLFFNFSPQGYSQYDFPLPMDKDLGLYPVCRAKEIFNTDGIQYGGTGEFRNSWAYIVRNNKGVATHFRFSLPPLSAVVFEEKSS